MAGASLRDIKRRIKSVKNTEQITRAMKMVAAAKLRRAQEQVFAARPWADQIERLAYGLAEKATPESHPLLRPEAAAGSLLLVVIGADRGLCGAFNANINRAVLAHIMSRNGGAPEASQLLIIGKKPYEFFRRREFPIFHHYTDLFARLKYEDAVEVGERIIKVFMEGDVVKVELVYHEFKSALQQRLVFRDLLPVSPPQRGEEELLAAYTVDYLYEPDSATVLDRALRRHVISQIWRALLESAASEHGARMTAMDAATENAVEMIHYLTLQYNRARQAGITKEIIEVVSGADALKEKE
jgi:F-type H+-transporting ATPase subunit gamma